MIRRVAGAMELLDGPVAAADRAASLADIERLSAWFGGYALTLREIRRLAARGPRGRALVVLGVGGGAAGGGRGGGAGRPPREPGRRPARGRGGGALVVLDGGGGAAGLALRAAAWARRRGVG